MSYAKLANLEPQYGLYSSFIGVVRPNLAEGLFTFRANNRRPPSLPQMIYAFFATSKDVSIGPVAVMSLETGRIISDVIAEHGDRWAPEVIATHLAFICGFIVLAIGLLRLGWLVEFIPAPAVAGFMTGSAISIAAGQVPALLGLTGFNTKAATYKVIIETLRHLKFADLNAAFGIPALVFRAYPCAEHPPGHDSTLTAALLTLSSLCRQVGLPERRDTLPSLASDRLLYGRPPQRPRHHHLYHRRLANHRP
jgi:sodium-independent sulfate anion transporter 11